MVYGVLAPLSTIFQSYRGGQFYPIVLNGNCKRFRRETYVLRKKTLIIICFSVIVIISNPVTVMNGVFPHFFLFVTVKTNVYARAFLR
jgi:hypothetical protein